MCVLNHAEQSDKHPNPERPHKYVTHTGSGKRAAPTTPVEDAPACPDGGMRPAPKRVHGLGLERGQCMVRDGAEHSSMGGSPGLVQCADPKESMGGSPSPVCAGSNIHMVHGRESESRIFRIERKKRSRHA